MKVIADNVGQEIEFSIGFLEASAEITCKVKRPDLREYFRQGAGYRIPEEHSKIAATAHHFELVCDYAEQEIVPSLIAKHFARWVNLKHHGFQLKSDETHVDFVVSPFMVNSGSAQDLTNLFYQYASSFNTNDVDVAFKMAKDAVARRQAAITYPRPLGAVTDLRRIDHGAYRILDNLHDSPGKDYSQYLAYREAFRQQIDKAVFDYSLYEWTALVEDQSVLVSAAAAPPASGPDLKVTAKLVFDHHVKAVDTLRELASMRRSRR